MDFCLKRTRLGDDRSTYSLSSETCNGESTRILESNWGVNRRGAFTILTR